MPHHFVQLRLLEDEHVETERRDHPQQRGVHTVDNLGQDEAEDDDEQQPREQHAPLANHSRLRQLHHQPELLLFGGHDLQVDLGVGIYAVLGGLNAPHV